MTLAAQRMHSQGLVTPIGGVKDVVHRMVGLQAQDDWVAAYGVRPRAASTVDAESVSKAEGLIRTWVMRGTLHLVTREDAGWLVALLGPRFIAAGARRRAQLGLTEELLKRALPIVRDTVPATRAEIAAAVRKRGLDLAAGQAEAHLVGVAAMSGLIHRTDTGYLPMPRAGKAPADPLHELARRYLAGHAPAAPEDFAAWSGLPLTEARRAFADLAQPSTSAGPEPVRLLGHWDPWLLGYKDRAFTLDPRHAKQIQRGGGFLRPLIVASGRVVGTWIRTPKGAVVPEAFEGVQLPDLDAEIEDLKRFFSPSGGPGRPRP
jgi:DNA glycosylase AlkZ-like